MRKYVYTFPIDGLSNRTSQDDSDKEIGSDDDAIYLEDGTFDTARETAMKLIRSAKEAGVSVAAPVVLKEGRRFASERLSFLEHWFPCIHQPEYQGKRRERGR